MNKHISLAIVSCLMFCFFSACDENTSTEDQTEEIVQETINEMRVENYSKAEDIYTKSTSTYEMPTSVPSDAIDMSKDFAAWKVKSDEKYYLPVGTTLSTDIKYANGVEYYIEGNLTVTNAWGSSSMIYVLPEGTLNYAVKTIDSNSIISAGTLNFPSGIILNSNSTVISKTPITISAQLELNEGTFIAEQELTVNKIALNGSSTLELQSCASTNELNQHQGMLIVNSCLIVDGNINLTSNAMIEMSNSTFITCKDLEISNNTIEICGGDENYSVISAENITIHQADQKNTFSGYIDMHGNIINNSGSSIEWLASVKLEGDTYIAPNGCHEGFGSAPVAPEPIYALKHIAHIAQPEIDLSATSICFVGNDAYLSWHKRGSEHRGWIDMLTLSVNDQNIIIKSSLSAPDVDFNHIYSSETEIFAAGNNKKGALMAKIKYATELSIETTQLPGSSANSVLRENDNILVATSGEEGTVTTLDQSYNNIIATESTPYAKSLFNVGNEISVLFDVKSGNAKVAYLSNVESTFDVGAITPEDGKNACVSDTDNNMYISMGSAGLMIYKDGILTKEFVLEDSDESGDAVNCVDVDENYIYVAYGTKGLYILDKETLNILGSYKYSDASANYVKKAANGILYVAYGTSGVHTLKFGQIN